MIKNFKKYLESISGTELMNVGGSFGPGYGEEQMPVTLNKSDTEVVYSDITSKFYSKDDYDDLYNQYLSSKGKPLDGFSRENLDKILYHLSKRNESKSTIREPTKVTKEDYNEKLSSHSKEDLTSREIESFNNVLSTKYINYYKVADPDKNDLKTGFIMIRTTYIDCDIQKLSDDWFVIKFLGKWDRDEYYICDDFEEVQAFLLKRYRKKLI